MVVAVVSVSQREVYVWAKMMRPMNATEPAGDFITRARAHFASELEELDAAVLKRMKTSDNQITQALECWGDDSRVRQSCLPVAFAVAYDLCPAGT
jgi:hypothetical protein